jgi:hypothetical protein
VGGGQEEGGACRWDPGLQRYALRPCAHLPYRPRTARRYQKLRKSAGLTIGDKVELYYEAAPAAAAAGDASSSCEAALAALVAGHGAYLRDALGGPVLHTGARPPAAVVIARERTTIGERTHMPAAPQTCTHTRTHTHTHTHTHAPPPTTTTTAGPTLEAAQKAARTIWGELYA